MRLIDAGRTVASLLIAAGTLALPAAGQGTAPQPAPTPTPAAATPPAAALPPGVDPKALALLRAAVDRMAELDALSARFETSAVVVERGRDGKEVRQKTSSAAGSFFFAPPDRLLLDARAVNESTGLAVARRAVADGSGVYLTDGRVPGVYVARGAAEGDDVWALWSDAGAGEAGALLRYQAPGPDPDAFSAGLVSMRLLRDETLAGVPVHVVETRRRGGSSGRPTLDIERVYVGAADGVLRGIEETVWRGQGTVTRTVLRDVHVNPAVTAETFAFAPPPGAKAAPTVAEMEAGIPPFDPRLQVGQAAPALTAAGPGRKRVPLSSLRGKVVLVDFEPEGIAPPVYVEDRTPLWKKYHGQGFEIVTVWVPRSRSPQAVRELTARIGAKCPWPTLMAAGSWGDPALRAYGVQELPAQLLVDRAGRVAGINTGVEEIDLAGVVEKALALR